VDRGYVKLYRKIEDSGLLQHPYAFSLFSYLLVKSAWKPFKYATRYGIINIRQGQCVIGRKDLAQKLRQTEAQIRGNLNFLKKLEIIASHATNRFSIITIINYSQYQSDKPKTASKTASSSPAARQQLTTDKALKHKNIIKYVSYFSEAFKGRYQVEPRLSYKVSGQLADLIKDGITEIDFKKRVDNYFSANWPAQKDLGGLLSNWDKMITPAKAGNTKGSKDLS